MPILKQKKFLFALSLLVALSFAIPHLSHAAGLVPCGGASDASPCKLTDIFILIAKVTNWLISVAGLYAVYLIVNHGFWLIVSMGNEEDITKRKTAITNAIVGFVLVMFAFMFVNTAVNVILGQGLLEDAGQKANQSCKFDLSNPWNYVSINPNTCQPLPK